MGFVTSFDVPFERGALYHELFLNEAHPLGTPRGTITALTEEALGALEGVLADEVPGEDALRTLQMPDGSDITYRILECVAGSSVKFEVLQSQGGDLVFHGKDGQRPTIGFSFSDVRLGTAATIRFDFERVTKVTDKGFLGLPPRDHTEQVKANFDSLAERWTRDMTDRGYEPKTANTHRDGDRSDRSVRSVRSAVNRGDRSDRSTRSEGAGVPGGVNGGVPGGGGCSDRSERSIRSERSMAPKHFRPEHPKPYLQSPLRTYLTCLEAPFGNPELCIGCLVTAISPRRKKMKQYSADAVFMLLFW